VRRLSDHDVSADEHASSLEEVSGRQRLTFLGIAALIAVVAIVVLVSGGGGDDEGGSGEQAAATATATPAEDTGGVEPEEPTATPEPTPTPRPRPPLLVQGSPRTLRFTQGERIRFRVRAEQADHVHVHGFDRLKDIAAGQTITFSFPADITGIYEVELEESGILLGNLRVDPA
jgi:hypothetical protein